MQNRSSHYDWFKGKNPNDQKNNWKGNLKTVWKFTRIFMLFSVFFFSMWGCVQTFTSKTNPLVGMGTELYASKEEISPQVTSIHISKDSANNIYIENKRDNIWFNNRQNPELFKQMQTQYKAKGVPTLDLALNGGNGITRIVNNLDGKKEEIYVKEWGNDDEIAVGSTLFKDESRLLDNTNDEIPLSDNSIAYTNLQNNLTNLKYYSVDEEGNLIIENFKIKFPSMPEFTNWNQIYNLSIINELFKIDEVRNFLLNDPVRNENESVKNFRDRVDFHNKQVLSVVTTGLNLTGAIVLNDWSSVDWILRNDYFNYQASGYTPIATWSQAFEMGRGSGPFYGIFVYPLSYVTNKLIESMPFMAGWESFISIVLIVVVVSLIIFGLSFKGTLQQTRMQELNAKKAIIEAKYSAYQGNKQMENRKKQEIAEMYKKEGINPAASLKILFIQMPLFLAMWRVVGTIQHIKGTTWLGINFAATSYKELFAGEWQYLPLLIVAGGTNVLSQFYPRMLTRRRDKNRINIHQKEAMKKANRTQNIMMVVFTFMTLIFSAGLQVYFIIRSLWRVFEVSVTHHILKLQKKKRIKNKIKA